MENYIELILLNDLYRKHLHRDVDESGLKSYLPRLINNKNTGKFTIEQDLLSSEEYKNHSGGLNSLAGDRIAYINNKDLSIINNSSANLLVTKLLELIILLDNPSYNTEHLNSRIDTIKESLIHIGKNNLPFTIFPHLEYDFNTDKFNDSMKNFKNFQYYILYMCVANVWKGLFNKIVDTCGTKNILSKLFQIPKRYNFDIILSAIQDNVIDYFSIRICGRQLTDDEYTQSYKYLIEHNSCAFIEYLESLVASDISEENKLIENNIDELNIKLGRKPKVLIMIAYLETQNQYFLNRMMYHINKVKEDNIDILDIDFALDNERIGKEQTDYTPWSRVKRIRNLMINKYPIQEYDYLYIIDSDMIDYPHNFLKRAIGLNPTGITAPMALIQNSVFFYDWCGFQKKGNTSLYGQYGRFIKNLSVKERNFDINPPYVHNDLSRMTEIDCVGCTYVVPSKVFSSTYGDMQSELIETFEIAGVKNHKIAENIVQYEDHPCFTDHFTVCAALRANGGKIFMDRGSAAYHADLPIHGEAWH